MSKKNNLFYTLVFILTLSSSPLQATPVLYDWVFNVDGVMYEDFWGDSMPTTGALDGDGMGSLSLDVSGVGSHFVDAYFNFDITEPGNTFFNEYGESHGVLASGQSWEIDEVGSGGQGGAFGDYYGDILFYNVFDSTLDNMDNYDAVDAWYNPYDLDNVSFALGWDFDLLINEVATINWFLSATDPLFNANEFYLTHVDPDSDETIYFWGTLSIVDATAVPEPSTLLLLGIGLIGVAAIRRRQNG